MQDRVGPNRVLLVDDRLMLREGLAALIDAQPGMEALAASSTLPEASVMVEGVAPDVALVEAPLSGQIAFARVRNLRGLWPNIHVILLASGPIDGIISRALIAQVDGVVTLLDSFQAVVGAVNAAIAGRRYYTPAVSANLSNQRALEPLAPQLTAREFEVLRHLVTGRTVKETAAAMNLAATTVDNHKTRIMRKVDVHTSVELTRYAIRQGLVTA